MTDRLNDPAECLNFFLKLGAGSHSNVYSQAVSSLRTAFDHAEAVNSGGCTNSLSTPLVASVALRLSSVVRPEDDKHDQERSPADSDNPISPHVKLYPVLAMLCDPGIENRKQLLD